ncbi:MAG TPA: hypothetical protein VGF77_12150 [Allosphingosinicella sp.]|jgi:drug/metabolite transporter (DMT)-like permease
MAEKPKNADAAAIALLRWILAGLVLVNGLALLVAVNGGRAGLLGGSRWNYVAGLLCALVGAICWAASRASSPKRDSEEDGNGGGPGQSGVRDQAIAFGAFGIMLWVASLTAFVTGLEHLSWAPAGDRLHAAQTDPDASRR